MVNKATVVADPDNCLVVFGLGVCRRTRVRVVYGKSFNEPPSAISNMNGGELHRTGAGAVLVAV